MSGELQSLIAAVETSIEDRNAEVRLASLRDALLRIPDTSDTVTNERALVDAAWVSLGSLNRTLTVLLLRLALDATRLRQRVDDLEQELAALKGTMPR